MEKLNGVVEAVGTKFNGSLKVNGTWLNFGKGHSDPTIKAGDSVTLTLAQWSANGKSGLNITGVEKVKGEAKVAEPIKRPAPSMAPKADMSKDEWAAKDRRISRQGCIQVAVQVTTNFDKAKELADKMLEFVNEQ